MSPRIYIVFVIFFLAAGNSSGQQIINFGKDTEGKQIAGQTELYEDKSGVQPVLSVIKNQLAFIPPEKNVPHYFSTTSAIWLKARIYIPTEEPVYMVFGYPMMDTIELFIADDLGNITEHKTAGSLVKIKTRDLAGNYPKFQLKPGLATYYIRIKSTYTLLLPITLKSYKNLYTTRIKENIVEGIYIGFALLIILYTFFLWVSLRDNIYIYYILHIISTAIIILHIDGYMFLAVWPGIPQINHFEPTILGLFIFSILFAVTFLNTGKTLKKHDKRFKILITFNLLVFLLDWAGFHKAANYLVQIIIITGCLLMLFAGITSYRRGVKSARFFLLAWTFFLTGLIITTLQRIGALPYGYYLVHTAQIGSALDMVLLSLALADRINTLRDEKEKALEESFNKMRENRELVNQQNALLSLRVEERTRELEEQRKTLEEKQEQLQEMNKTKDKIFSVIAHDLRGPLANVSQLADMMAQSEIMRGEDSIAMLKDASKQSFNLLDNLLLWARAQYGDAQFQKGKVDLHNLTENTMQLFYLKARAKDILVENNIPVGLYADADTTMIATVIRNLISNALKYTMVGGKIEVSGRDNEEENTISVWVRDSGLGIPNDKLPSIFEAGKNKSVMGTDGETGTGLGLVICKDFVEKNKGTISVSSRLGQGTMFTITLPRF